ncbi:MAG: hypothetical protein QM757_26375 [Paludibaculum sp.]
MREAEDVSGMVLSFEQFQAAASGDPRVYRKLELDAEIDRLSARCCLDSIGVSD